MSDLPLRIALLGVGTVGRGTYEVLTRNAHEIARRAGRPITVACVAARNPEKARRVVPPEIPVVSDFSAVVRDASIDVVVELIGGEEPAKSLILEAIAHGKHIVTANKALLALHGHEIFSRARERDVIVAFEAAVAGGIPIIKMLREGLVANRIEWIAGIINGTTNFILSEMRSRGLPFAQVLQAAQEKGYAEADPTFDIEGIDAGHKLAILASLAFGIPLSFERVFIEGITRIEAQDIRYAEEMGYRIKLLAIARRRSSGIELRVHPTLIPSKRLMANVEGVMNAILVKGDAVGPTLYYGAGAGAYPTASAVIADLVDVARLIDADPAHRVPYLAYQHDRLGSDPILPIEEVESCYYLRLRVDDRPGVLADITRVLADHDISIDALLQKEPEEGEAQTDIILLTHETLERSIRAAIARIEAQASTRAPVVMLRLEKLA
ncbi:MAG: homoserine dehydrogenase [Casimicrobiaceae bacterium]|nr:homoserine dehydrogenase [Casimicrobiaceae bacterium]MCX8098882.1 homoserine dehydrogenase [Casimicrobiaceae bacterium]MDW8312978.1 homoserine dehydrogenase [Burkholderiales bacterium]